MPDSIYIFLRPAKLSLTTQLKGVPMKKIITVLALVLSASTFADDFSGSFRLNDGKNILKINIGNERDADANRSAQRITRLEKAVSELQEIVYSQDEENRRDERRGPIHTCLIMSKYLEDAYTAEATTKTRAAALTVSACIKGEKQSGGTPKICSIDGLVKCEAHAE